MSHEVTMIMIVTSPRQLEAVLKNLRGQFRRLQALRAVGGYSALAKGALLADLKEQIDYVEDLLAVHEQVAQEKSA